MQAMVHLKQFERLEPKQEYLCSRPAALVLQLLIDCALVDIHLFY